MKKNAQYEIDHINETIILTKKFMKEASVMGTPEYKELMMLKRENPGFTLMARAIQKSEAKTTYHELSLTVMGNIITDVYKGNTEEQAAKIAEFEAVKDFFKENKATQYGHVKAWFVKNYKQAYLDRYGKVEQNIA